MGSLDFGGMRSFSVNPGYAKDAFPPYIEYLLANQLALPLESSGIRRAGAGRPQGHLNA